MFVIMARMRVSAGTDYAALVDYWTDRARRKDVLPLLHSLEDLGDAGTLDLIHLLPQGEEAVSNPYVLSHKSPDVVHTSSHRARGWIR